MASSSESRVKPTQFIHKFRRSGYIVLSLPLLSFSTCLILTFLYNFEESVATHCKVPQFLPSLSAAICNAPQSYIWRIGIGFHSGPRIYYNVLFYDTFQTYRPTDSSNWPTLYWVISVITVICGIVENFFLMLLTNVPSTENHRLHIDSFVYFITFAIIYMMMTCLLYWWKRKNVLLPSTWKKSFRYKLAMFLLFVSFFGIAMVIYVRHNAHCEPYMYSYYALCQYLIILSNVAFHTTAMIDFWDTDMITQDPALTKAKMQ